MLNFSKKLQQKINFFRFEISSKKKRPNKAVRASMHACLQQALQNGLKPATIIDVGAAQGTPALYEVFPKARHIFVEPLKEFTTYLDTLVGKLDKAEYIIAAAGTQRSNIVINVHPDLVGSSIYKEGENSNVNGVERIVPVVSLDRICEEKGAEGPYLIKIDTQGSELNVLRGAEEVLQKTDFVILEVSLFEFFQDGPQLFECINFMKKRGFVAYDLFNLQYRLLDGAMSQVDIAFVRENSHFRTFHFYATEEQREKQNQRLIKSLN
ncbi:FkbM family methyltransferase [Pleurocapsales cyanobacterium LEGE 10410]|nr:FkbM family methyltransferase [Pleurocapsales cyanobacterium LEGE 10410]